MGLMDRLDMSTGFQHQREEKPPSMGSDHHLTMWLYVAFVDSTNTGHMLVLICLDISPNMV